MKFVFTQTEKKVLKRGILNNTNCGSQLASIYFSIFVRYFNAQKIENDKKGNKFEIRIEIKWFLY